MGDDDGISVSTASQALNIVSSNDLRSWLKHHNRNVSKQFEHNYKSEKERKHLLHGLHYENNPEKALETVLSLAVVKKKNRNGKDVGITSNDCHHAITRMLHDTSMHDRYSAGINAATLLAEQRRKIVMNALTDVGYSGEEKKESESKLADYLETREREREMEENSCGGKALPAVKKSLNAENLRFRPKWEHYDTMRSRWGYIQPQVKHLAEEQDVLAPRSCQRYMRVDKETVLVGNLNDIRHYESMAEKKSILSTKVGTHSRRMQAARDKKAAEYYIPSPCVYY
ncbi:hypothetical protein B484DRAFT_451163 [Ochromonadaceae sp. CCMP2298]|nr:hypothetical protein B484DRAFT_451163 [Ochromonadaceae sp. CCMP2298]